MNQDNPGNGSPTRVGTSDQFGGWSQLPDGRWLPPPRPDDQPQAVKCWYMRDGHTFRALPLDVDAAIAVLRAERDAGETHGMLCGKPNALFPNVHAGSATEWDQFEAQARPWLERAVAMSKPPNAAGKAPAAPADGRP